MKDIKSLIENSFNWKKDSYEVIYSNWHTASNKTLSLLFQAIADRGNGWGTQNGAVRKFTCDWLVEHRFDIPAGELNIFDAPSDWHGRQLSAVSKICHIINPIRYPLIWDSHIRVAMGKENISVTEQNWNENVKAFVENHPELKGESSDDNERIWLAESTIWANNDLSNT